MGELTIDQLAERTGLTVRNIRAYRAKHLLHPPSIHGRAAVYDESHVERIELIRRLQDEGFNLDAARRLIEQGEAFTEEVSRMRADLVPGADDRTSGWIPMSEAALELTRASAPDTVDRLLEAKILRRDGRGQLWVRPEFRIGWRLLELGLPPSALYELLLAVDRQSKPLGRVYADQVQQHVLDGSREPAVDEAPELDRASGEYEEMTTVAAQLMTAAFEVTVRRELERALEARLRSRRRTR
jgi:DNA-binding transcriptional MerR regulator